MYSQNAQNNEPINNLARQQQGFIRAIGGLAGRVVATVSAAMAVRYLREQAQADQQQSPAQNVQQNIPQNSNFNPHQTNPQATQQTTQQTPLQPQSAFARFIGKFKHEAVVSAASVFSWNARLGEETGANALEYIVNKGSEAINQGYGQQPLPNYAGANNNVYAERATQNMLSGFFNYVSNSMSGSNFPVPGFFASNSDSAPRYSN